MPSHLPPAPTPGLQEYAGIDATRLEAMEQRLKADVLAEAARYNGRVLVARWDAPLLAQCGACFPGAL
jgi:hypothetical protein